MIESRLKMEVGNSVELEVQEDTELNVVLITDHNGDTVAISKELMTELINVLDKIDNGR